LYLNFTGLKNSWRNKPALSGISFSNLGQLTTVQDSVLNAIHEGIVKNDLSAEKASKQGTIIRVQVTAANSQFARLMTERLVDAASKLYLDIRVGTAERNIQQLQRRSDSLLLLLNNKSYKAAASQPLDINPGIKTASVPVEIAMRDKTVLSTLYAEVTKNLEASKMLLSQQTPVIELLDRPEYLLKDLKKSLSFSIVVFFALMVCVYLGLSFILFFLKNNLSKP
jgi:paraquat-inducible protein B